MPSSDVFKFLNLCLCIVYWLTLVIPLQIIFQNKKYLLQKHNKVILIKYVGVSSDALVLFNTKDSI